VPRVVHFEITANDPEKVVAFYQEVFGWKITKYPGPQDYWLVTTGEAGTPGIDGGIFRPGELFTATVNTIDVPDLDAAVEKVKAAGGQTVTPKSTIPGVGYQIYCKDVEGTLFGLHQADPQAKAA
jgi:predicted enzyme related to lactoylglutathione lyase